MTGAEAIAQFEAQPVLQPGEPGWWKVWGASPRDIRAGDIVIAKTDGRVETFYVENTFLAKTHPIRIGMVVNGEQCTIGVLAPIALVRQGTKNMLSDYVR